MSTTQSSQQAPTDDIVALLTVIAKKQPVFTTCFVCLALYGLSMMFFFNREAERAESWVSQDDKKVQRAPEREAPAARPQQAAPVAAAVKPIKTKKKVAKKPEPVVAAEPEKFTLIEEPKKVAAPEPKKEEVVTKAPAPAPVKKSKKKAAPAPAAEAKKAEPAKKAAAKKEAPAKKVINSDSSDSEDKPAPKKKAPVVNKKKVDEAANTLEYKLRTANQVAYETAAKGSRGVELDFGFEEVAATKTRATKNKKRDPYDSSSSEGFVSELSDWELNEEDIVKSKTIRYERPEGVTALAPRKNEQSEEDSDASYYDEEEEPESDVEQTVKEATQHIQQQKEKRTQPAAAAKTESKPAPKKQQQQQQKKPEGGFQSRGGRGGAMGNSGASKPRGGKREKI